MNKLAVGQKGENLAANVALAQGYRILERNYRCPLGEIDLILARDDLIVFLEVKTRHGNDFGEAWEAVTPAKQQRIQRVAVWYAKALDREGCSYRFDVFTIRLGRQPWQYRWFKGAF